jgi:hypothetical protein
VCPREIIWSLPREVPFFRWHILPPSSSFCCRLQQHITYLLTSQVSSIQTFVVRLCLDLVPSASSIQIFATRSCCISMLPWQWLGLTENCPRVVIAVTGPCHIPTMRSITILHRHQPIHFPRHDQVGSTADQCWPTSCRQVSYCVDLVLPRCSFPLLHVGSLPPTCIISTLPFPVVLLGYVWSTLGRATHIAKECLWLGYLVALYCRWFWSVATCIPFWFIRSMVRVELPTTFQPRAYLLQHLCCPHRPLPPWLCG